MSKQDELVDALYAELVRQNFAKRKESGITMGIVARLEDLYAYKEEEKRRERPHLQIIADILKDYSNSVPEFLADCVIDVIKGITKTDIVHNDDSLAITFSQLKDFLLSSPKEIDEMYRRHS